MVEKLILENESRLLLVNDTCNGSQMISEILREAGYDVNVLINGNNIVKQLLSGQFDLVIYDLTGSTFAVSEIMGQLNGILQMLEIHILFLTPRKQSNSELVGALYPGVDFLSRPFCREELYIRINNRLEVKYVKKENKDRKYLLESINFAYRIQKSMLPNKSSLEQIFDEHFVLDMPLNILSGDFYWVKKIDHLKFFVVADCTGHGVPGALLSVLGISILNELSIQLKGVYPNTLLDNLRAKFKESLLKTSTKGNEGFGMDVVACMIDTMSNKMFVSGAYNSVYIIRKGEVIELSGDKQPVGFFPFETPFSLKSKQLEPGDEIYASSDGYEDQFGGQHGKKLQKRNFLKLLQHVSGNPMDVQQRMLTDKHLAWKGNIAQLDDILVMGCKV